MNGSDEKPTNSMLAIEKQYSIRNCTEQYRTVGILLLHVEVPEAFNVGYLPS